MGRFAPGYGYAKTAKARRARWERAWGKLYRKTENFRGVVWLLDIRHPGLAIDLEAGKWLVRAGLPAFPVLTKCDKLPKSAAAEQKRLFVEALGLTLDSLVYWVNQPEFLICFGGALPDGLRKGCNHERLRPDRRTYRRFRVVFFQVVFDMVGLFYDTIIEISNSANADSLRRSNRS